MIKICGIRSLEEAEELCTLDIDFFGLIFADSKRQVTLEDAQKIADIFKKANKKVVGVFTKESQIDEVLGKIDLDVFQLHGEFSYQFCKDMLNQNKEVWRVFRVSDKLPEFGEFKTLFEEKNFYPLFDTLGDKMGGNGEVFKHKILSSFSPKSFIIAGGLSEYNCLEASAYMPYVLDFNSKVEINNRKNKVKIEKIIDILKVKL